MVNENMGVLVEEELDADNLQPSNLLRNVERVTAAVDIVMLNIDIC
jgi:hypothetical protein